ncbi:T9SS type A sorting domain-containing protein [Fulvivirga sp. M361]|uniref:LamG-like jellyroll fold domain-containing protein n=1 Tax=Fulvivirga sp. M361 TaxID=2594266 RepID=UPI00117BB8C6|nr:LamG-like jellyroll fold domain-containing protein [Fulvivirga sp. M361]TRX59995.1 T9SS type A sorting domain-containing protein [Fulvivirga sp. M361]
MIKALPVRTSYIFLLALILSGKLFSQQTPKRTSGSNQLGYLEHLPPDYDSNPNKLYPVLIFLHGSGEKGDGSPGALERVKKNGPPRHIKNGHKMCYSVGGVEECYIVISPQLKSGFWRSSLIHEVMEHVINGPDNYRIDPDRILLTGLSLGGGGTYNYAYGPENNPNILRAMAPVAAFGAISKACVISERKINVWAFHGTNDRTITYNRGKDLFDAIEDCTDPVPTAELRFSTYQGVGHNSWSRAYATDHSVHNPNLYEWFLDLSRDPNNSPGSPPYGPDRLQASAISPSQVALNWADNSDNEEYFEVQRATDEPEQYTTVHTSGSDDTEYLDNSLESGTTYYYRVRAVNDNGTSDFSPAEDVTTPVRNTSDGGIVGHWKLNNTTLDETANNINGTLQGGADFTTSNKEGTHALQLDGQRQYIDLGNPDALPEGRSVRSLSAWATTQDVSSGFRWIAAFGKGTRSKAMFIGQKGKDLVAGGYQDDLVVPNFWQENVWHHITLTYDGTVAKLYADGVEIASENKNWSLERSEAFIGKQVNDKFEYWNGLIDDVRIYDKVLTDTEIVEIISTEPPPTPGTLVGHWKLNNTTLDETVNNINGTLQGGADFSTVKKEGTHALQLDGQQQYIDLGNPDVLPEGKAARSLSAWATTQNVSSGFRWIAAFGKGTRSKAMFIGQKGKDLVAGGYQDDLIVPDFWQENVWHHITLTYDGTVAKLYADGVEIASENKNWPLELSEAFIGKQVNNKFEYWNGLIDDVRIYDKVLTDTEIKEIISAEPPPTPGTLVGHWKLNNTILDETINNINGTLQGGADFSTIKKEGTHALQLDGQRQYIDLGNPDVLPEGKAARSLSAWATTRNVSTGFRWIAAFGKGTKSKAMFIGQKGKDLVAGGYQDDLVVPNFWQENVWHHITLTYDGTVAKLYADGIEIASENKNWPLELSEAFIGKQVNNKFEYWNGRIDDVRIYNKVLTGQEIEEIISIVPPQPETLVGHWKLNNTTVDETANSINGTLQGGADFSTVKKEGTHALELNGQRQYIDLGNPDVLPEGEAARSLSAWATTQDVSNGFRWIAAFGKGTKSKAMFIGQKGKDLVAGGYQDDLVVPNFWQENVWHHITLTYDGTVAKLYADGVEIASENKNWPLELSEAFIGKQVNDKFEYWNGLIDDVRIYKEAIGPEQVTALATARAPLATARTTAPASDKSIEQGLFEEQREIRVYPNPFSTQLHLELDINTMEQTGDVLISVFDLAGNEVFSTSIDSRFTTLDLNQLRAGMYIYYVTTDQGKVKQGRIVKSEG